MDWNSLSSFRIILNAMWALRPRIVDRSNDFAKVMLSCCCQPVYTIMTYALLWKLGSQLLQVIGTALGITQRPAVRCLRMARTVQQHGTYEKDAESLMPQYRPGKR